MSEAIFNTETICAVTSATVADLKERALAAPRGRFRLCLHQGPDALIQEMLIVLHRGTAIMPHRHPAPKSESYHVLEGALRVFFFDDAGTVTRILDMGPAGSGKPFLYRLSGPIWHMPVPLDEWAVYHEAFAGPFDRDRDLEMAPWAPPESDSAAVASFLKGLGL